jgi:hypothetical protein
MVELGAEWLITVRPYPESPTAIAFLWPAAGISGFDKEAPPSPLLAERPARGANPSAITAAIL